MGRASEILIPARFLLTVGHFVVVVMAFHNRDSNVSAGLPADSSSAAVSAAANSLLAALGLAVICHAVCLAGLFLGWTLFADRLNAMHMVLHFFGGVLTSWFIIDLWGYASYWAIFVFFSLLPALLEGGAWLHLFWLKTIRY